MQILVLSEVNKSSEQNVIQAKLQLVEAERQKAESEKQRLEAERLAQQDKIEAEKQKAESEKQRLEAERLIHQQKLDADFEYQSKLIRLRHEDSERDARIAQEREAQKRDEAERVARIVNERELREQAEKERFAFAREQSRIKHEFEKERFEKFFKQALAEQAERHKREREQVMRAIAKRAIVRKQCFMCGEYGHIKKNCSLRKYRINCLKCLVSEHFCDICSIRTKTKLLAKVSRKAQKHYIFEAFEAFHEMDFTNLFHTNSDVVNEDYFASNEDCIAGKNEFFLASENNLSQENDLNLLKEVDFTTVSRKVVTAVGRETESASGKQTIHLVVRPLFDKFLDSVVDHTDDQANKRYI